MPVTRSRTKRTQSEQEKGTENATGDSLVRTRSRRRPKKEKEDAKNDSDNESIVSVESTASHRLRSGRVVSETKLQTHKPGLIRRGLLEELKENSADVYSPKKTRSKTRGKAVEKNPVTGLRPKIVTECSSDDELPYRPGTGSSIKGKTRTAKLAAEAKLKKQPLDSPGFSLDTSEEDLFSPVSIKSRSDKLTKSKPARGHVKTHTHGSDINRPRNEISKEHEEDMDDFKQPKKVERTKVPKAKNKKQVGGGSRSGTESQASQGSENTASSQEIQKDTTIEPRSKEERVLKNFGDIEEMRPTVFMTGCHLISSVYKETLKSALNLQNQHRVKFLRIQEEIQKRMNDYVREKGKTGSRRSTAEVTDTLQMTTDHKQDKRNLNMQQNTTDSRKSRRSSDQVRSSQSEESKSNDLVSMPPPPPRKKRSRSPSRSAESIKSTNEPVSMSHIKFDFKTAAAKEQSLKPACKKLIVDAKAINGNSSPIRLLPELTNISSNQKTESNLIRHHSSGESPVMKKFRTGSSIIGKPGSPKTSYNELPMNTESITLAKADMTFDVQTQDKATTADICKSLNATYISKPASSSTLQECDGAKIAVNKDIPCISVASSPPASTLINSIAKSKQCDTTYLIKSPESSSKRETRSSLKSLSKLQDQLKNVPSVFHDQKDNPTDSFVTARESCTYKEANVSFDMFADDPEEANADCSMIGECNNGNTRLEISENLCRTANEFGHTYVRSHLLQSPGIGLTSVLEEDENSSPSSVSGKKVSVCDATYVKSHKELNASKPVETTTVEHKSGVNGMVDSPRKNTDSSTSSSASSFKSATSNTTGSSKFKCVAPTKLNVDEKKTDKKRPEDLYEAANKKVEAAAKKKQEHLQRLKESHQRKNEEWKLKAEKMKQAEKEKLLKSQPSSSATNPPKLVVASKPPPVAHLKDKDKVFGKYAPGFKTYQTSQSKPIGGTYAIFTSKNNSKPTTNTRLLPPPAAYNNLLQTPNKKPLPGICGAMREQNVDHQDSPNQNSKLDSSLLLPANNYEITVYEDYDDNSEHRANKHIPAWAKDKSGLSKSLFKQLEVGRYSGVNACLFPFPSVRPGAKLYSSIVTK